MVKTLGIAIDEDLLVKLDEIAKEQNRSRSNLIETILKDYLKDKEWDTC